ncbi:CBS domain-containing protein [Haliangium sp.]|uniref:CBS domain-containing protein n=1 Tax=Haliangium sp. TaxID=2663208 RepID=UPI003D0A05D0
MEGASRALPAVGMIMRKLVHAVDEQSPLADAVAFMRERGVPGAPVVRGRTPVGVLTLAELIEPGHDGSPDDGYSLYYQLDGDVEPPRPAPGWRPSHVRVGEVMRPFVLSIEVGANLVQAANRMLSEGVRRLLVRDGTELVGQISCVDLLSAFARLFAPEVGLVSEHGGEGGEGAPPG